MSSLGQLVLKGKSGNSYTFKVYDINSNWNSVAAVYSVTRATSNEGKISHHIIYIGQTNDLKERFQNHHKQYCFDSNHANRLCVLIENNVNKRLYIESDLIANYNPKCND